MSAPDPRDLAYRIAHILDKHPQAKTVRLTREEALFVVDALRASPVDVGAPDPKAGE